MKRSLHTFALFFGTAAYMFSSAMYYVGHAVVAAAWVVKDLALHGFKLAANQHEGMRNQLVHLVQAKAFALCQIKRDRPEKSAAWSMCQST